MSDTITWPAPEPSAAIRALTKTVRGRVITATDPDLFRVNQNITPANGR